MHSKENSSNINQGAGRIPRPDWLKIKPPGGNDFSKLKSLFKENNIHTVCEEARCPNINECWNCGTATFIILGDVCSRNCRFCAVNSGKPQAPDNNEPLRIAESVKSMGIKHAVITSVTRDDLPDGGAALWAETVKQVKILNPRVTVEILVPDFGGSVELLDIVLSENPDVLNHNVETVSRLYPSVRQKADYRNSLKILEHAANKGFRAKSGLMVGLGETFDEIIMTLKDMREAGVRIVTIGQYLQPTRQHIEVSRYVHPSEYEEYIKAGELLGFDRVEAAPLVRSSYHAGRHV